MAFYKKVPARLHSELSEYSYLLRSLRTTQTLDVASHLQASISQQDGQRDTWTRWPLPVSEIPVPEWTLTDEITTLVSKLTAGSDQDQDIDVEFITQSTMNHLQHILAAVAATCPQHAGSLQNRLQPLDWNHVLNSLYALPAGIAPDVIEDVAEWMKTCMGKEQDAIAARSLKVQNKIAKACSDLLKMPCSTYLNHLLGRPLIDRAVAGPNLMNLVLDHLPLTIMSEIHVHEIPSTSSSPRAKTPPVLPFEFSYQPSDDGTDENLLILLHGLGDTQIPFANLGKSLKLPQTATLALRAPEQVPFLYEQAFQWYPSFDHLGEPIQRPNPTVALDMLTQVVNHLEEQCEWPHHRIHLFGFGQGGTVASELGMKHWQSQLANNKPVPFGSITTVAGPLLSFPTPSSRNKTPLLVAYRPAPSECTLPASAVRDFKAGYEEVTEIKLGGARDGMPASKDEWLPIMRFWSQVLARRQAEGLYQVFQ